MWSQPATWKGGPPANGDDVVIPSGTTVVLDTSTPSLGGLRIDGTLIFKEKDLDLTAEWVVVHGRLQVGKATDPFLHRARITLTGNDRDEDIMGMGTKVLGVMGGTLDLHGKPIKGWTQLGAMAEPGDTDLVLKETRAWRRGDRIVVASSDYWSEHYEERTITHVSGKLLELDEPLDYQHWGTLQTLGGRIVDERAEVGLLSRNVVVRGNDASTADGFGGHSMIMEGSTARIDGVEFANMGQKKALRRYPVHFHMDGVAPDSYLKRSSIHHSFNRCVTVHGTNELLVQGNVCFDHPGHGFFLEDGAERDNVIKGNLGLGTRSLDNGLLPSDDDAATFWITNPDNKVTGNVAAGSEGIGFWYALPKHPTGLSEGSTLWPRRTPLGRFSGNVAHSNGDRGLNVDSGPRPNGETEATYYDPRVDPADGDSDPVTARFEGLTAYMNRDRGVWLRGENHVVSGAVLADNRAGATFASSESFLEDSLVVGETANKGTTEEWEDAGFEGRALPFFWEPNTPIMGFEFYDGRVGVKNTRFVNFASNPVRESGALGYLAPDAFSIHPKNFAENVSFVDATRVYLTDPEVANDGDVSKVFVDKDGSVTGTSGTTVVVDNPFLLKNGCEFRPAWNAHLCDSDYATLLVYSPGNPNAIKPLKLTRPDGVEQTLVGCCEDSDDAVTTIMPNKAYEVTFNGGTPSDARFVLWRGAGDWLQLSMPLSGTFDVERWGSDLDSVGSLSALANVNDSAYFYDSGAHRLHVRLVAGDGDWEEVQVSSRTALVPHPTSMSDNR
jgi:cell migration-inducing and hyaluronan-binding protein